MPFIELQLVDNKLTMTSDAYLIETLPGTCTFLFTGYPKNVTVEAP